MAEMTFEEMLDIQRAFQSRMGDVGLDEQARVDRMSHLTLLAYSESCDMMAMLGYKTHHPFHKPQWGNALYEWVDQFKYMMAVAAVAGFTADEIERAFTDKSIAVEQRLDRDRQELVAQPVVVFDIDGVLCEFKDLSDRDITDGAFLDVTPDEMMCAFTHTVQAWGVKIVLVTSRKDYRWRRVASDTEIWLRNHGVACDRLVFAYDKAEAVSGFNVLCAVEDSAKHALAYAQAGIDTILIDPDRSGIHDAVTSCSRERVYGLVAHIVATKMEAQYAAE